MLKNSLFTSEGMINAAILGKKQIFILYTGINAKRLFFCLLQNKVKVLGFATINSDRVSELYGLKVFRLEEIDEEDSVYVADKEQWDSFQGKIDPEKVYLANVLECQTDVFTFVENGKNVKCNAALMLTMMLSRMEKKRSVFLINFKDYDFWKNLLDVLKDKIQDATVISLDTESDKIYDLLYDDLEKIIFFVCIFSHQKISEFLVKLGLKPTYHFVVIGNSFSGHVTDKYSGFDWYLGNTFVQKKEYPGFYIHGEVNSVKKKLVILGNSATDPLFYPQKSWSEMLWEIYRKREIDITIFNGAVTDYSSMNEVIKLFRDVLLLQPDIVVSYSGIIDFRSYVKDFPYLNLNLMRTSSNWKELNNKEVIYGLTDHRSAYERWLDNEKIMQQICDRKGIAFYGILQPWLGSECKDAWKKLQMWSDYYWQVEFPQFSEYIDNAKEFKIRIEEDVKRNDWLYDFTDIFKEIDDPDIYYDSIHVNERGNLIVAEKLFEIVTIEGEE